MHRTYGSRQQGHQTLARHDCLRIVTVDKVLTSIQRE